MVKHLGIIEKYETNGAESENDGNKRRPGQYWSHAVKNKWEVMKRGRKYMRWKNHEQVCATVQVRE